MSDLANVTIVGRMVSDAEVKDGGNWKVTKFTVAVNHKSKGEKIVSYFDCEAWGKSGDVITQYGHKGKEVAISGTIRIDSWEGKDGTKRSKPVIKVYQTSLRGGRREDDNGLVEHAKKTFTAQPTSQTIEDDLPF